MPLELQRLWSLISTIVSLSTFARTYTQEIGKCVNEPVCINLLSKELNQRLSQATFAE